MKLSTVHPHNTTQIFDTFMSLWKAQPSVLDIRDGYTQLFSFQLAASRDWGLWLANYSDDTNAVDGLSKSNKQMDARWVNIIFDLLLTAPQAHCFMSTAPD